MNIAESLAKKSIEHGHVNSDDIASILNGVYPLLQTLDAAYNVRHHYFGKSVRIHVIQNVKSGGCSEDCGYTVRSRAGTPAELQLKHRSIRCSRKMK